MLGARNIRRLHPDFAVELAGLDLRRDLSARAIGIVDEALGRDRVVVVRGQKLGPTAQLRVAASLGTLYGLRTSRYGPWCVPDVRYETAGQAFYNELWHADLSWAPHGSPVTVLYAVEVDAGCASTTFADMVGAYRALDESTKVRVGTWRAHHHVVRSRAVRYGPEPHPRAPDPGANALEKVIRGASSRYQQLRWSAPRFRAVASERPEPPGALHPVVQTDSTGRRFIHAGDHAWTLAGAPEQEGLAMLDELNRRVITAENVYDHRWASGDLVLFDNRSVLHRRDPDGDAEARRVLRRCVVWRGEPPPRADP